MHYTCSIMYIDCHSLLYVYVHLQKLFFDSYSLRIRKGVVRR